MDPSQYSELIGRACAFHPWDAMAPDALSAILRRGPFQASMETGCGASTIVLSHISSRHTAFAIEGEARTITGVRDHADFRSGPVVFVEGETKNTLPVHRFNQELDLVLLDGPHAYPLPQLEFVYISPSLRTGGWLVLDDLQIPSVHHLFRFLKKERSFALDDVVGRTAFFRRTERRDDAPDGWMQQGLNRHAKLRYSWRDQLRKLIRSA